MPDDIKELEANLKNEKEILEEMDSPKGRVAYPEEARTKQREKIKNLKEKLGIKEDLNETKIKVEDLKEKTRKALEKKERAARDAQLAHKGRENALKDKKAKSEERLQHIEKDLQYFEPTKAELQKNLKDETNAAKDYGDAARSDSKIIDPVKEVFKSIKADEEEHQARLNRHLALIEEKQKDLKAEAAILKAPGGLKGIRERRAAKKEREAKAKLDKAEKDFAKMKAKADKESRKLQKQREKAR